MSATSWLHASTSRLSTGWLAIVESTVAATVAWLVATVLLHHPQPFFAPAAALIVLGQGRGQRVNRALEVLLGVAGGVLVTDVVVQALGSHSAWTIFVVIAVTLTGAVTLGASTVFTVQATVSALYIAVVTPPSHSAPIPLRFTDALVGGTVALVVSQVVVARDPLAPLTRDSHAVCEEVAHILEDLAAALVADSEEATREALERARRADAAVKTLQAAVTAAGEALWFHARRRERLGRVGSLDEAAHQVDYIVRNVRVLARACVTLTRLHQPAPDALPASVRALADAVRAVDVALVATLTDLVGKGRQEAISAEDETLAAVRTARGLLTGSAPLAVVMIVGQLRATAIDLLRGLGADDLDSLNRVDEAIGLPAV